ncbi:hypothetical protein MPSEU_000517000 [Mayamaea pseudoterrestris]|nr:hypothetical protein MPSEU_000517000 [Mayamaea pseudoterrestris]
MRLHYSSASFLLLLTQAMASFKNHVVNQGARASNQRRRLLNDALLEAAVPLGDYERKTKLQLSEARQLQEGDDFENMEGEVAYTFTGYSLKYAQCQPIQYFSENAIKAGEFSPMITEDIVILRLCPQKSCLSSETFGCHYNFAEYALTLSEYTSIMLKYSAYKRDSVCEWCATCIEDDGGEQERRSERKLDEDLNDDGADDDANQADNGDEAGQGADGDDAGAEQGENAGNEQEQQDDDGELEVDDKYVYQGSCTNFNTYCANFATECQNDDDAYLDYEGYLDYMDCAEIRYNDYAYFVKPRCDGSSGAIKMAVYNDNYCIQSASSDVSVKNFGLGFKDGFFETFYSSECIECSESDSPPFYAANSLLCNKIHSHSAMCAQEMVYDLFETEQVDETTECNYIDSLLNGAYDQYGQFSTKFGGGSSWDASMTTAQAAILGVAIALCILFIISACYLHHSMTNLLLKSLSHRELLPRKARSRSRTSREGSNSRRSSSKASQDPDWESPSVA